MSSGPPVGPAIAPFCDLCDQHCIIEAADIERCPNGLPPGVVILDSDGASNGTGPLASYFGWRSRGLEQAISVGEAIMALGYAGFCEMPQEQIDIPDLPWNVSLIDYTPLRILSPETGRAPPDPPAEYITVEVCKKTGLLAGPYCPVTEMRQFKKGEEPIKVCRFHKEPRPGRKRMISKALGEKGGMARDGIEPPMQECSDLSLCVGENAFGLRFDDDFLNRGKGNIHFRLGIRATRSYPTKRQDAGC